MLVPGHFGTGDGEARYGGGGCREEAVRATAGKNEIDFRGVTLGAAAAHCRRRG